MDLEDGKKLYGFNQKRKKEEIESDNSDSDS